MALAAGNRDMSAGQHESCLLVSRQAEGGRFVSLDRMTTITRVEIRCGSELPRVLIRVAIGAAVKLDLELRVLPLGNMTLRALHACMSALERIPAARMLFHGKRRRAPSLHGVAVRALGTSSTFLELSLVRIRLVAIGAAGKCQRLLEIAICVALFATHREMFPQQGIFGFRMIKFLADRLQ